MEKKTSILKSSDTSDNSKLNEKEFVVFSSEVTKQIEKARIRAISSEDRKWLDVVSSIPKTVKLIRESDAEVVSRCENIWQEICTDGLDLVYNQLLGKAIEHNRTGKVRPIIFYGPPSGGKSTLCQLYAKFLASSYYVVDTPSLDTGSGISGYNRSYQSAGPGVIVDAMIRTNSGNPLIVFEEIDKAMNNPNYQSVQSCLLSLLDHNSKNFTDNYMSHPINTELCKFAFSANDIDNVSEPLKSRCELIHIPQASAERVCAIVLNHAKSEFERLGITKEVALKSEDIVYLVKHLYNDNNCKDIRKHKGAISKIIIDALIKSIKGNKRVVVSRKDIMASANAETEDKKITMGFLS